MDAVVEELSFRMVAFREERARTQVIAFDRRTYPALIKLHLNERSAIVNERRNSRDCELWERKRQMEVFLKRAYEEPVSTDGFRVLVDRLWPRAKGKAISVWMPGRKILRQQRS
jgi:hypothetical protein